MRVEGERGVGRGGDRLSWDWGGTVILWVLWCCGIVVLWFRKRIWTGFVIVGMMWYGEKVEWWNWWNGGMVVWRMRYGQYVGYQWPAT